MSLHFEFQLAFNFVVPKAIQPEPASLYFQQWTVYFREVAEAPVSIADG